MKLFSFLCDNETVYIHAERREYAVSKAAKLSRLLFNSTKFRALKEHYEANQDMVLMAQQMSCLLNEPVYVGLTAKEVRFQLVQDALTQMLREA